MSLEGPNTDDFEPGPEWRPATRWERFRYEMRKPRLSIEGFIVGMIIYAALRFLIELL
jgi:hypothetical protein